jgi:hypothetical protein
MLNAVFENDEMCKFQGSWQEIPCERTISLVNFMLQIILSEEGRVYYIEHNVSIGLCFFSALLFEKF